LGRDKRHLKDTPAARFEYSVELSKALSVVGYVFQDVVAEGHVEPIVFQRDVVQIKMQIRQGRFDVSGQDGEVAQAFESAVKALFWGDVQEVLGTFEKVGKSLQV